MTFTLKCVLVCKHTNVVMTAHSSQSSMELHTCLQIAAKEVSCVKTISLLMVLYQLSVWVMVGRFFWKCRNEVVTCRLGDYYINVCFLSLDFYLFIFFKVST